MTQIQKRWPILVAAIRQFDFLGIYATGIEIVVISLAKFGWVLVAVIGLVLHIKSDEDCGGFFGLAIIWLIAVVAGVACLKKRREKKRSVQITRSSPLPELLVKFLESAKADQADPTDPPPDT